MQIYCERFWSFKPHFFGEYFKATLLIMILFLSTEKLYSNSSLEVYGGYQTSPHSVVTGEQFFGDSLKPIEFTAGWKGKSFSMPPYYGLRFTNWYESSGWGLDFTHSKAYADKTTLATANLKTLQFTDGLNNLILHRQVKIDSLGNYYPYYGYGFGVIVPHVEFQSNDDFHFTHEYQLGGPSVSGNLGIRFLSSGNRYIFSEYKFTASWLDVDLKGGGNLRTVILTNALNFGVGYNF